MKLVDLDSLKSKILNHKMLLSQHDELCFPLHALIELLDSEPTVLTPDPVKHGHWHDVYMLSQETVTQTCSCCQNTIVKNIAHWFNYCPACGAKMDLED